MFFTCFSTNYLQMETVLYDVIDEDSVEVNRVSIHSYTAVLLYSTVYVCI